MSEECKNNNGAFRKNIAGERKNINWDLCYVDNQDCQNNGNKSSHTQDNVVSIGLSSSTRLAKKTKNSKTRQC